MLGLALFSSLDLPTDTSKFFSMCQFIKSSPWWISVYSFGLCCVDECSAPWTHPGVSPCAKPPNPCQGPACNPQIWQSWKSCCSPSVKWAQRDLFPPLPSLDCGDLGFGAGAAESFGHRRHQWWPSFSSVSPPMDSRVVSAPAPWDTGWAYSALKPTLWPNQYSSASSATGFVVSHWDLYKNSQIMHIRGRFP